MASLHLVVALSSTWGPEVVIAILAHNTAFLVTFWVPLPFPLGVADGTEMAVPHKVLFPEDQPGLVVPEHPDGPQYLAQSWLIYQKQEVPTSPGVGFAESLMRTRLEQDLGLTEYRLDTSAELKNLGLHRQTVVESVCAIKQPEHYLVVAKLNEVIQAISEFHTRLNMIQGLPATRFSARAFDPVPFLVTPVSESEEVVYGLTSAGDVTKYSGFVNVPEASTEQIEYAGNLSKEEPFRSARVLETEALNAHAVGSNILAAICFGAAAESRLTELCQFICWEAEVEPSVVSKAISRRGGVANSCLQLLGKHLKGNWHRHNSPVLKRWHQHIVTLRNQTAHNGYEPTSQEVDLAQSTFYELLGFLRERLLAQIERYPYVVSYYIGQPKLRELGYAERWEKAISDYPLTHNPDASFFRYKGEVRFAGENRFDFSQLKGANILQITHDNATPIWVQLDDGSFLCRRIAEPQASGWSELQRIRIRNSKGYHTEVLTDLDGSLATPLSAWTPASNLIPSLPTRRSDQFELHEYKLRSTTSSKG